jgi:LysM repeat protein
MHLKDCVDCRDYAEEIKDVENILLPIMKRQWNLQPAPLSMVAIRAQRNSKIQTSIILATRIAATGIVFLALVFSAWQFALSGGQTPTPSQFIVAIPPVPTPSAQSTSTKIALQSCAGILYRVQEKDTLESIAHQFSVPKVEIMMINHTTETVVPGTELMIPLCSFTPTSTMHPTFFSTKYTPSTHPTTSTPGG